MDNIKVFENDLPDIDLSDENGDYSGFSFQHGLQILDNGNIVTLDNGNISSLLFDEYQGNNKTRALEISINELNGTAEIVWEYILDDYLFGALSGNTQKLDNGNYLITTIGDYGHTIEVNASGEIVSDYLEVACGDKQSIKIKEIQRQGKRPQNISEFMLGSQIKKGSIV